VEAFGHVVHAVGRVRPVQPWRRIALTGGQPHLAGQEQFPAAEHGSGAGRESLGVNPVVPAPPDVHTPHLAAAKAEPGIARDQHERGIVPPVPTTTVPQPRTDMKRLALWRAFPCMPAGQVQDLVRLRRHRQGDREGVQPVPVARAGVGQPCPGPDQPGGEHLHSQLQTERRGVVGGLDQDTGRVCPLLAPYPGHGEQRRPSTAVVAVPRHTWETRPAQRVLRQHGNRNRVVEDVGGNLRYRSHRQPLEIAGGQIVEVWTPVQDPGKSGTARVDRHLDRFRP
jgi:hypothetical protein